MPKQKVNDMLRKQFMPHIWCPGCGHGIIMHAILRAIVGLEIPKEQVCISSGIGCSSRMPGYIDACTLHTAHGRSLAFATGVKMANPDLTIINVMGDGDATAIGGNHFIHACRRNIGITAVVMNNNIYGMTGGQASPTTPEGAFAATTPYGAIDPTFDICKLAVAAGATYVARATVAQPAMCEQILKKAIEHQKHGFAMVELVSYCHTQFGRKNKRSRPIDNINFLKDNSVNISKAIDMSEEELKGKIVVGEFLNNPLHKEYTERYDEVIEKAIKKQEAQNG
ncbi:MAG: thiamine pyrophosphate-dependent enzyme [Synergistaceae bacterium]